MARLSDLNDLDRESAARAFLRCCGSTRWAREMAAARPFATVDAMIAEADRLWTALDPADWLEAFRAHPRIGERAGSMWSAEEQSTAGRASDPVRARLAERNREYEARFGYIFVVSATGKSAEEMLADLESRLDNASNQELRVAAEEQREIMHLRLRKLLDES